MSTTLIQLAQNRRIWNVTHEIADREAALWAERSADPDDPWGFIRSRHSDEGARLDVSDDVGRDCVVTVHHEPVGDFMVVTADDGTQVIRRVVR